MWRVHILAELLWTDIKANICDMQIQNDFSVKMDK